MKTVRLLLVLALTGGIVLASAAPAPAKIRAIPNVESQFRKGARDVGRAIIRNRNHLRRVSFSLLPPGGRPVAIANNRKVGFPRHGRTYLILSTGDARAAFRQNSSNSFGRGQGGPFVRGARDVTIVRVDLRVPSGVSCLSFAFRFLTEEFPEFVGDRFNDFFIAELGSSSWTAASNEDPTITAPGNFAFGEQGRLITVNGAGATSVGESNASGTTYDGATDTLRASTPVEAGRRTVYFSIGDQGDRNYDSAVLIDNLRLDNTSPCQSGAVVDE